MARQQAEVLGVGRLQKKINITKVEAPPVQVIAEPTPEPAPVAVESEMQNMVEEFNQEVLASAAKEVASETPESSSVPLPGAAAVEAADANIVESTVDTVSDDSTNVSLPEPEVEEVPEMSDVEIEFRALVTELMAAEIEPSDMMNDPRWEDISERALAIGFETWPVFLQLTSM
jgi:hypothetical protein